jgi:uncharacterized Zn finger protein
MALTTRLGRQVPDDIRARVRQYLDRGAVRILRGDAHTARTRVRGTESYRVDLDRYGDAVEAACTCPFYVGNLLICKHIGAALLAAEGSGHLGGEGADPLYLVAADAEDEDDLEDDWEAGEGP